MEQIIEINLYITSLSTSLFSIALNALWLSSAMPTQIHSSRGQGYPYTSNGSYLANLSLQELKGSSQSAFSDTVPGNRMNHQIPESLANYTLSLQCKHHIKLFQLQRRSS